MASSGDDDGTVIIIVGSSATAPASTNELLPSLKVRTPHGMNNSDAIILLRKAADLLDKQL